MQLNELPHVRFTLFIYYTNDELPTFNFNIQNFNFNPTKLEVGKLECNL